MWRWTSVGCTRRTLESTSAEQPISMGQTRPGRSSNAPARQESCTSHSFRRAWCPSTGSGRWNLAGSVLLNSWRPKRKSSSLALWQNQKQWALRKVAARDSAAESLDIQSQGWCGWSTGTLWSMWVYIPDMSIHDWDDYTYQCLINHDCLYLDNDLIHGQMLRRTLSLPCINMCLSGKPTQADLWRHVALGHPQMPRQGRRQNRGDCEEPVRRGVCHHHPHCQEEERWLSIGSEA